MSRFQLNAFLLIISILAITAANAQTNSVNNTGGNGNANTNINANINTNINANAIPAASKPAAADATPTPVPKKSPAPGQKLKIIFSGADPYNENSVILQVSDADDPLQRYTFLAEDAEIKALLLTKFKEGDIISVVYEDRNDDKILKDISVVLRKVSELWRYGLPILVFLLLIFLSYVLLRGGLRFLIVGEDNRYSKSKLQIAAWFFVLISTYISVFVVRFYYSDYNLIGGIGIPTNLLILSGLSALTFVAAKGITQGNVNSGMHKPKADSPRFADLFQDDAGQVDLGDFQLVIITSIAIITYIVQIFGFLGVIELYRAVTLPDVDSTILASFGLGHGAYLIKKAVAEGAPAQKDKTSTSQPPAKVETETQPDVPSPANDEK